MAINENFIFADPRIQQGVTSMAAIRAAEEAAKLQRQAQSQQSYVAAQVARENAAAERARNDAYLNQREREAARQDLTLNKDLDLRRTMLGRTVEDKERLARAKAQYDTLALIAGNKSDPPPPTEWATNLDRYGKDLSSSEKDTLTRAWEQTRAKAAGYRTAVNADIESYNGRLRAALATIEKGSKDENTARQGKIDALQKEITKNKQNGYIHFDPASNSFVSRLPLLRQDPPKGPGAANQEIPEGIRALAGPPKIESFDSVLRNRTPVAGGGFFGFDPSVMAPDVYAEDNTPPVSRQSFAPPAPLPAPVLASPPAPQQQFGSDLRTWQPPGFVIPNSGSVGYYPPPSLPSFQPAAAPQVARQDPGSFLNFLQQSAPRWMYRPAFAEGGMLGPGGLAGQGIFGQGQAVAAPPSFVPPPQFVPQYISTDTPPAPRFVPGYESATQGMNLTPPVYTPPPPTQIPPWLYSPIFGRQGLLGPTGLSGQGVFGQTNQLRY